jgi:creatinine amidohydrolase
MQDKIWFAELTMKEAEEAADANKVIIVLVGSVEEHGLHLPLCTDSVQPEYVAVEAAKRTNSLIAPPINYGVCTTTRIFPGTISISFQSLYRITCEIIEEFIRNGFKRFLILSGHADEEHMSALRLAAYHVMSRHMGEVKRRELRIMVCSDYDFAYELRGKYFSEDDGHGGTIETSRMMAIKPELVKKGGRKNVRKLPKFEVTVDPREFLPDGIRGEPEVASIEKGKFVNEYIIGELVKLIEELKK